MVKLSKQAKVDRIWNVIETNDLDIQTLCDMIGLDREEFFRITRSKFLENYSIFNPTDEEDEYYDEVE